MSRKAITLHGVAKVDAVRLYECLRVPFIVQPIAPDAEPPRGMFAVTVTIAKHKSPSERRRDRERRQARKAERHQSPSPQQQQNEAIR